eukprot:436135-Amphidinium_carterae.1
MLASSEEANHASVRQQMKLQEELAEVTASQAAPAVFGEGVGASGRFVNFSSRKDAHWELHQELLKFLVGFLDVA